MPPPEASTTTSSLTATRLGSKAQAFSRRLSLRARILMLVASVLALSLMATVTAMVYTTSETIKAHDDHELQVMGRIVARMLDMSSATPQMAEDLVGAEMVSTAHVLAELVALSERTGRPTEELRRTLKRLVEKEVADEIAVTDASGRAYLNVPTDDPLQFGSNVITHPQTSAFWPLLKGEQQVVVQPTLPREGDDKVYKYVGVSGVDKQRIVQVGYKGDYIAGLRAAVGFEKMAAYLVQTGSVAFLYVRPLSAAQQAPIGFGLADNPTLKSRLSAQLQQAMDTGVGLRERIGTTQVIISVLRNAEGYVTGGLYVGLPTKSLLQELLELSAISLGIAAVVMALAFALTNRFVHRLSRPITTLTQAADQVQQGNFSQLGSLDAVRSQPDEIGQLAGVFQRMALEVKNREQVLDNLVKDRTQQLTEKNAALETAQRAIDSELHLAQKLQLGILPTEFPAVPGCQGAALVVPAASMGGDFFDYYHFQDGRVGLVVADVSGKGVTAAFFMALVRTGMLQLVWQHDDPAQCLAHGNRLLCTQNPLDMFVTLFYGVFNPKTGELVYANGGHNPPFIRSGLGPTAHTRMLPSDGDMALGVMPDTQYRTHRTVLEPNSTLLLYSDGVTEAFNTEHQAFGEQRLQLTLQTLNTLHPQAMVDTLYQQLQEHTTGAAQSDDITLMAMHWQGPDLTPSASTAPPAPQPQRP